MNTSGGSISTAGVELAPEGIIDCTVRRVLWYRVRNPLRNGGRTRCHIPPRSQIRNDYDTVDGSAPGVVLSGVEGDTSCANTSSKSIGGAVAGGR